MQDLLSIGTNRRESMIGTGIGLGLAGYRLRTSFEAMPSLDLQFADRRMIQAVLGPTPSFSRASTGTYFDSQGVLKSAAVNGPRFNHTFNGTSWVSRGLLVEEQRTNINLWAEEFNNAAYSKNQATIDANQASAPDGATTADKFTASAGTVNPYAYQAVTTASASVYTFSIYVKKNTHDFVQIVLNGIANGFANFNVANGTLGTVGAGGSATASIFNAGNGWYRCVITYTTSTTAGNGYINLIDSSTAGIGATFSAAGTESVYLWGQQLELGSFPTSYIPTTSASVTRSADVCQITGGDFSGFYNQNEGSVVLEFDGAQPLPSPSPRNFPSYLSISKGNSGYDLETNSFGIFGHSDTNRIGVTGSIDRVTQYEIYSTGLFSPNMTQRSSFGYAVNNFGFTNNGENVLTDTSGTNPNQMAYLHLGKSSGGTFSCHIARLRYYPVRLSNSKLQELST